MKRHIVRHFALSLVLAVIAYFAVATQPPEDNVAATTNDERLLHNVAGELTNRASFDWPIAASGSVDDYRYKVGPAATEDPVSESDSLATHNSATPDRGNAVGLQGLDVDQRGSITTRQTTNQATVGSWAKKTAAPGPPEPFDVIAGAGNVTLMSAANDGTIGHVVVRRIGDLVNWQPTAGHAYSPGELDASHRVVYVGSTCSFTDRNVAPGTTYHYAAFAFDSRYHYSDAATGSATPTTPSGPSGDFAWHPVQCAGLYTNRFSLAMDDFGDAMCVGYHEAHLSFNTYSWATETWTDEQLVPGIREPVHDGVNQELDGDGAGNFILGYCHSSLSHARGDDAPLFHVMRYSAITGWQPPESIDTDHPVDATNHSFDVAICSDGTGVAVWQSGAQRPLWDDVTRIHARRFDGNSWGPSVLLGVGESPRVAADQAGNFMVLFRASGSNTSDCGELHCRYYNDGWIPEKRVNVHDTVIHARTGNDNHDYLVSASGTGRFVALYKPCVAGNVSTSLHARTFDGSTWGVEQVINVSPDEILSIDLAASVSGTAIAVWCQRDVSAVKSIFASHYDGADWSVTPTRLSMAPDGFFGAVADVVGVTVDVEGNGIALIRQCADVAETNTMEVFKIHFNAKAGWDLASRRPLSVLKDDMNECSPQIAGNGYGEAVVIWGRRDTDESFSRFFGQ